MIVNKNGKLLPTLFNKNVRSPIGFCRLHMLYMNKSLSNRRCGFKGSSKRKYCKHYIVLTEDERFNGLTEECMEQCARWNEHHMMKKQIEQELQTGNVELAKAEAREWSKA